MAERRNPLTVNETITHGSSEDVTNFCRFYTTSDGSKRAYGGDSTHYHEPGNGPETGEYYRQNTAGFTSTRSSGIQMGSSTGVGSLFYLRFDVDSGRIFLASDGTCKLFVSDDLDSSCVDRVLPGIESLVCRAQCLRLWDRELLWWTRMWPFQFGTLARRVVLDIVDDVGETVTVSALHRKFRDEWHLSLVRRPG